MIMVMVQSNGRDGDVDDDGTEWRRMCCLRDGDGGDGDGDCDGGGDGGSDCGGGGHDGWWW